jgi:hypothetical protein
MPRLARNRPPFAWLYVWGRLDICTAGMICLMPVVVYPRKYVAELRGEIEDAKAKIASDEQAVFESVDALFAKLEEN